MFRRGLSVIAGVIVCVLCAAGLASADRQYGQFWVYGSIERGYLETGGPGNWGNPTSPEQDAARGGKFQTFGGSSFYWHPNVDPARGYQVGGLIGDKWGQLGWESGDLRYPTTHELGTPDGSGRFNFFEGGAIYWSPAAGAHALRGQILETWAASGYEKSSYGYPTSDEYAIDGGKAQNFQRGTIEWKQDGYPGDWAEDSNIDPNRTDTQDAASAGADSPPQLVSVFDNTDPRLRAAPRPLAVQDTDTQSCDTAESLPEGATCVEREVADDPAPPENSAPADTETPPAVADDTATPGPSSENGEPTATAPPVPSSTDVRPADNGPADVGTASSGSAGNGDQNRSELFAEFAPNAQASQGPTWCNEVWRGGTNFVCQKHDRAQSVTYVNYKTVNGRRVPAGSITGTEYREIAPAWNKTSVPFLYDFTITKVEGDARGALIEATPYCTPEPSCPISSTTNPKTVAVTAQEGVRLHGLWGADAFVKDATKQSFDMKMKMVVYGGQATGTFELGYTSFRCDSLGDSKARSGCKTSGVIPVFNEVHSGPNMRRHLQSAKDAGLPGFSYQKALRRQANPNEIRWNRDFSCGMVTGPRPSGMDCDEYPYASSSYVRAQAGRKVATYSWCNIKDSGLVLDPGPGANPVSSVCLIPSVENRSSGGRLGWFYRKTRTLDTDFFFVAI